MCQALEQAAGLLRDARKMRLRNARLADIEPVNLPDGLLTVTNCSSRKRGRRKKETEVAREPQAVAEGKALEQRAEGQQPQHNDPVKAFPEVASDVPEDLQIQPEEPPLFNAEAAAEALRLAQALLSSPAAEKQLFTAQPSSAETTRCKLVHSQADLCAAHIACAEQDAIDADAMINEAHSKHAAAAIHRSEHAAKHSARACLEAILPGQNTRSGGKGAAADTCPSSDSAAKTSGSARSVSAHADMHMRAPSSTHACAAAHNAQRAGATAGTSMGAGAASEASQQVGTQRTPEPAQHSAARSNDTWQPQATGADQSSASQRRAQGRASLVLQSHRASRKSGAAEAFERGLPAIARPCLTRSPRDGCQSSHAMTQFPITSSIGLATFTAGRGYVLTLHMAEMQRRAQERHLDGVYRRAAGQHPAAVEHVQGAPCSSANVRFAAGTASLNEAC